MVDDLDRRAPLHLIAGQVLSRDQPTPARHLLHDEIRDPAVVEDAGAAVGDELERAGEVGLDEPGAGGRRLAIHQELGSRGGEAGESLRLAPDLTAARTVQWVAVARQLYRRCDQLLPGEVAEPAMRLEHPGDRARHADRTRAGERRLGRDAGRIDVHVAGRGRRCGLAEIEGAHGVAVHANHHEAAAADVAGHGVYHGQGERDGHRCIDCIATATQDVDAHVARQLMRADHNPVGALDRADALAERPGGGDERARCRWCGCGGRGGKSGRFRDGGSRGDCLRRLGAPRARAEEQQAENERSTHAELCTLTRVRVNV